MSIDQQRPMSQPAPGGSPPPPPPPPLAFPLAQDNSFRICGLPTNASRSELQSATAAFRRAMKLGVAKATDWDLPWLGRLERTEGSVQNASGQLSDVERRLTNRLFWFGEQVADLARLGPGAVPSLPPPRPDSPEYNHDIALLELLHAGATDPTFLDGARWRAAIAAWQQAVGADGYWSTLLDQDRRGGFEPLADLDDIVMLRRRAVDLALSAIVAAAKSDAAGGGEAIVSRIVAILRTAPIENERRFTIENEIIGPLEEEIIRACGEIRTECRSQIKHEDNAAAANKPICLKATERLQSEILPRLARLERIAGRDAVYAQRSRGEAAHSFAEIAACWTWAGDFVRSEELLKRAQALAIDTPAQGQIQEQAGKIANPAQLQRDRVKPIKSPPSLRTVNGVGTQLYSLGIKYPPQPELQLATLYLVVLFIPVIPLRRYLVRPAPTGGWYFHSTLRFGVVQWVHLAGIALLALAFFLGARL
jgi:hypothetical protein